MADTKITALAAIGANPIIPSTFPLPMVDLTDTSMAASGTTKKVTVNQILQAGGTATLASATITGAATVGTTFGVTGASTFTGAATFNGAATLNGNTTLGDAQTDTSTINAQLTARQGEFPSAVRAAASDYAAVNFDGATANTRITSTLTGQNIGTGDFSIWQRVRIPAANPGNSFAYTAINNVSNSAFDSSGAFGISQEASGVITVFGYVATVFTVAFTVTGIITNYGGQIVDLVLTRSTVGGTSTLTLYINGSSVGSSTAAVASQSVTTGYLHTGVGAGKQPEHRCYRSVVFNRALSATDVTELITVGVNPADQWGTQTGQTSGTLVASKRYRITTYVSADSFTNVGAASNTTGVEFVATGTTPTTWTNASTLNRIGGLVDLDFTVGAGYQATDRSTNSLHGTLFNGVEFTVPKKVAVVYATTNTNGNQQMLGTLAIPTNAIIEDIIVNSTGSATVSVGNASAGTQIVNGASVVSGRQKLTLATPFSTTGNLWVNSNSTATLQFTILYTVAA
jgi:hypothetical protein